MKKCKWTEADLREAVKNSKSIRQVLKKLGLIPAGGNYTHITYAIKDFGIDRTHLTGKGWSKGLTINKDPLISIEKILVANSRFQSYKLKKRLFKDGIKRPACEECSWAKKAIDGRIPVELDHINGDRMDNRLENLRILCPNCHSLKPTHRGLNRKKG